MASSPPASPSGIPQRPMSAMIRPPRSTSRMSVGSKHGGSVSGAPTGVSHHAATPSRASDDDARTSVKVAVRVRPPLTTSDPGFELIPTRFQRSMVQVTTPTSLAVDSPQGRKLFVFDRVFAPDIHQDGIWQYLNESVAAFLQGYNVSLLAYGQSGSGKSYTMGTSGPAEQNDPDIMGVIPRAANALFDKLGAGPASGARNGGGASAGSRVPPKRYSMASMPALTKDKSWSMKATYVEIYNEQLRDLLLPETVPAHERSTVQIREDTKGRIILTGLHQVEINSVDDLLAALNFGSSIRQTDATAINAKSSRSHAVFSINLVQRKSKASSMSAQEKRMSVPLEALTGADTAITVDSKLHFVDLAGSERLKNTGAQGDRAKEGISINAGLASLGKVISQLSSRQSGSHVSYRDSRLTRLLQDSLGGNAITYMIACVTPAEFHLSETLNTVQYAQRARAIQSKPRIQQVDDGDKQALIDRLRAEIAFLREQIHNRPSGSSGHQMTTTATTKAGSNSGGERSNEKEIELQDRLLDVQENYTALSQRHARLISEMAQARDQEATQNADGGGDGESAVERLKRSSSFAEAVERVVSEYEKTIQSLESSLSSTRSSLSTTESSLLEKETKCAYVETVNTQLQTRVQKLVDREASTESYLHDLETKLDSQSTGEEKNSAIVAELRKEIARVRENEASCEDYISTLEERLAESDQDAELMQREIERLEHVVERQRSIGKLDSLLYELDHPQKREIDQKREINGDGDRDGVGEAARPRKTSHETITEEPEQPEQPEKAEKEPEAEGERESPAQSRFMADKLENVTQELVELRMEHESTVYEYDTLSNKYEEALRTLSELQDAVDEARHPTDQRRASYATSAPSTRPTSFLDTTRTTEARTTDNTLTSDRESKDTLTSDSVRDTTQASSGTHMSSSRSLSSELFSAGESATTEASEVDDTAASLPAGRRGRDLLAAEVASLKKLHAEKEENMGVLAREYNSLHDKHQEALDLVEELRSEIRKAKLEATNSGPPGSPGHPGQPPSVIRRKSSQNMLTIDRAHRSFASLRNIASDNLEDNPDAMQAFEINLNGAMHELHARSERVQELEAEIAQVKKEMEAKTTIINGLTRERTSMNKSSPMDISVVSTMRDQLVQSENQVRELQASHAGRERELQKQIDELKATASAMPGEFIEPASPTVADEEHFKKVTELQTDIAAWETRHADAMASMQGSEKQLQETIRQLENQSVDMEALRAGGEGDVEKALATQRGKHETAVKELESALETKTARLAELETAHSTAKAQVEEHTQSREATQSELDSHRTLIDQMAKQIDEHREAISSHQTDLQKLHDTHVAELESAEKRLADQTATHQSNVDSLHAELTEAKDELARLLQGVATVVGEETVAEKLIARVQALVDYKNAGGDKGGEEELRKTVAELTTLNEESVKEIERLNSQYKKSSRIVEELEEQLSSNFDQQLSANSRFSVLETERHQQLVEANNAKLTAIQELETAKEELARLGSRLYDSQESGGRSSPGDRERPSGGSRQRSNSTSSNLRKSSSVSALPSPPPAIPLPPLPQSIQGVLKDGQTPQSPSSPSSPTPGPHASRDMTPGSPVAAVSPSSTPQPGAAAAPPSSPPPQPQPTPQHLQLIDDQEARIRTIEKHLMTEKQLTSTLEEALVDLENQGKKAKEDLEGWKKKAWSYEDEIETLKRNQKQSRYSMQAVEEERNARREAEAQRAQLEQRMNALNKKKKKGTLNCF